MRAGPSGENRMLTHGGSVAHAAQPWEAYVRITGCEFRLRSDEKVKLIERM
jgi:hypothetical protein